MKKETKLQVTKTNNFVHIPKLFIDNLGWENKEELILEYKKNEIVIRKKED
jgi:hypothetical protein